MLSVPFVISTLRMLVVAAAQQVLLVAPAVPRELPYRVAHPEPCLQEACRVRRQEEVLPEG